MKPQHIFVGLSAALIAVFTMGQASGPVEIRRGGGGGFSVGSTNFNTNQFGLNGATNVYIKSGALVTNLNVYGQTNFGTIYASGQIIQFANTSLREISSIYVGTYGGFYANGIYNDGAYGLGGFAAGNQSIRANASGIRFRTGDDSAYTNILAQNVYLQAGGSSVMVRAGGVVYQSITAVGNVGAGEDDLISQSIAANVLSNNGDRLRIICIVVFANNVNSKHIRAYWAGTSFYDTGAALTPSNSTAVWEFIITRTGAATQNITTRLVSTETATTWANVISDFDTGAATLANANIFKLTGEAIANDDISQKELIIEYLPAP